MSRIITRNNAILFTLVYVLYLIAAACFDFQSHHDYAGLYDSMYWLVILSGFTWDYFHRAKPNDKSTFWNIVYFSVIMLASVFLVYSVQDVMFCKMNEGISDKIILSHRQADWDNWMGAYCLAGLFIGFGIFTFLGGKYIESK